LRLLSLTLAIPAVRPTHNGPGSDRGRGSGAEHQGNLARGLESGFGLTGALPLLGGVAELDEHGIGRPGDALYRLLSCFGRNRGGGAPGSFDTLVDCGHG